VAYIEYLADTVIPDADRVRDRDNILRVHSVHSRVMRLHYELYRELMHRPGPLSREQREKIAVTVSARNECHY
jgi:hypothetical protein